MWNTIFFSGFGRLKIIFVFLAAAGLQTVFAAQAQAADVTAAVDITARLNSKPAEVDENRLEVRGAELILGGPLDSLFEGQLNFAGHSHEGSLEWGVHEAYLQSAKFLPRTTIKVGQFLLGIGILNQQHRHDWVFTDAPKGHRVFFAEENATDAGLEVSHLFLGRNQYVDVTLGVTNGYCYGHCDQLGRRPLAPVHYLRLAVGGDQTTMGLNYWGYTDFAGERVWHTGVDFQTQESLDSKNRPTFQSELYYRNRLPRGQTAVVDAGGYGLYQKNWNESWSSSFRVDLFSELNRRWTLVDEKRKNLDYGLNVNLNYQPSDSALLRWGYSREVETQAGQDLEANDRLDFQIVYLIGGHEGHAH